MFSQILKVETANDDTERRSRRSVHDVERRFSNVPESNSATVADMDQIKSHIKMCQKLFNENKINVRNAWDMKIIDYINQYVSNNVIDSETILVAATTLEVCVKVYGCRVDYLGQEIMKLANATRESSAKDDNLIEEESNDDGGTDRNPRNKKRKKRSRATISKDLNTCILNDIPKFESCNFLSDVDINASNYENMFIQKIPLDHAGYVYTLLNNVDCGFISYKSKYPDNNEKMFTCTFPALTTFKICPEFKNFHVDESYAENNESIATMMGEDVQSRINSLVANEIVYDDQGIPVPELDGSRHDIFADDANDVDDIADDEIGVVGQAPTHRRVEVITSFCPTERSLQRENSARSTLCNSFLETIWVGPSHWKNKLVRPSAPRFSGKTDERVSQGKTKRKRPVRQKIAEIDLDDTNDNNGMDLTKTCSSKKTQYNLKKCTLPPNILTIAPEFDKLGLLNLIPKKEYQVDRNESEFEHGPYDYNNADDSQYCSQVDMPDVNDDPHEDVPHEDMQNVQDDIANDACTNRDYDAQPCFNATMNLINAPDLVTQTYIPYASRAKKVNMKKLKTAMLKCLVENSNVDVEKDGEKQYKFKQTLFSDVYKKLPAKLPKNIRSEISVPLAFFSLLHLTNEYNLNLTEFENLTDLKISKK